MSWLEAFYTSKEMWQAERERRLEEGLDRIALEKSLFDCNVDEDRDLQDECHQVMQVYDEQRIDQMLMLVESCEAVVAGLVSWIGSTRWSKVDAHRIKLRLIV
jgi:hypothetical protein